MNGRINIKVGGGLCPCHNHTLDGQKIPHWLTDVIYDAATDLIRMAIEALDQNRTDLAGKRLGRAKSLFEKLCRSLGDSMNPAVAEEFCAFYRKVHAMLIEADYYDHPKGVREALSLLMANRQRWRNLVRVVTDDGDAHADIYDA
jgi:flagellin-specific chaperone FliS